MFDVKSLSADDYADTFKRFTEFIRVNGLTADPVIDRSKFSNQVVSIFCNAGYFFAIASVLRASFVDKGMPHAGGCA